MSQSPRANRKGYSSTSTTTKISVAAISSRSSDTGSDCSGSTAKANGDEVSVTASSVMPSPPSIAKNEILADFNRFLQARFGTETVALDEAMHRIRRDHSAEADIETVLTFLYDAKRKGRPRHSISSGQPDSRKMTSQQRLEAICSLGQQQLLQPTSARGDGRHSSITSGVVVASSAPGSRSMASSTTAEPHLRRTGSLLSGAASALNSANGSEVGWQEPVQVVGSTEETAEGTMAICGFEIIAELGRGNFGKVQLVVDSSNEPYALKTLHRGCELRQHVAHMKHRDPEDSTNTQHPPSLISGINEMTAVEHEIAIMKRCKHKNIVRLHAVIEDPEENQTHLVMQYIENGPVTKLSDDGRCKPVPVTLAINYMLQVSRGLRYLHERGIAHRDIKPENILIGRENTAYLADFGVSTIIANNGQNMKAPKKFVGTLCFSSPEQLNGSDERGEFAKEADIWAFGATLFCLLFGNLPFAGSNGPALVKNILQQELVVPQAFPLDKSPVPEDLCSLLKRLLHKNPLDRCTLAGFRRHPFIRHFTAATLSAGVGNGKGDPLTGSAEAWLVSPQSNVPLTPFAPGLGSEPSVRTSDAIADEADDNSLTVSQHIRVSSPRPAPSGLNAGLLNHSSPQSSEASPTKTDAEGATSDNPDDPMTAEEIAQAVVCVPVRLTMNTMRLSTGSTDLVKSYIGGIRRRIMQARNDNPTS
jgi:serine/threonine protein kinase